MISLYINGGYEGHFTYVYHWYNSMGKPQVKVTIFERYVLKRPLKRDTCSWIGQLERTRSWKV